MLDPAVAHQHQALHLYWKVKEFVYKVHAHLLHASQGACHSRLHHSQSINQSINQSTYLMSWGATGTQQTRSSGNQCWQCQQPCDNQQSLARSGTSGCELMCCLLSRWRKLEGSDPSAYEMIQKVQTLQKRLIAKTEEVVEADLLIQEKEKLYVELKNILARQPGPEVAEQLSIYQVHLNGLHNPAHHAISTACCLCV